MVLSHVQYYTRAELTVFDISLLTVGIVSLSRVKKAAHYSDRALAICV